MREGNISKNGFSQNVGESGGKPLCISDNRNLRFFIIFILYVAQGAPIGLFFYAIPAWLAASGASALEIGSFVSMTALPWSLKFLNGFLMDRYTFLPMGRRRAWLAGSQFVMVIVLLIFAMINPLPEEVLLLSLISFAVNLATSFQDVAVDGMAVDLVPDGERARANGLMFGGQAIGIAAGATFSGLAISALGISAAVGGNAFFVFMVLLLVLLFRERPNERLLPWTVGESSPVSYEAHARAWLPLLKSVWATMLQGRSLLLCAIQFLKGTTYGFFVGTMPLIATNISGWTTTGFSSLTGSANLTAGLFGVFIFGFFIDWTGWKNAAFFGFATILISSVGMALMQPYWQQTWLITGFVFIFLIFYTLLQVIACVLMMKFCAANSAATQFSLYNAVNNFGVVLGGVFLAPVGFFGGYPAMLLAISVAAAASLLLVKFIKAS